MSTFIKKGFWEELAGAYSGWLNLDELIKKIVPSYSLKYYTAFISQTGVTAPIVSSLLQDDISNPIWSYSAVGTFLLTKIGAFTLNKTVPKGIVEAYDVAGNRFTLERTSADVMTLKTYAAVNTTVLANGVITDQYINIQIYL